MSIILKNPHSVLAVFNHRPKDVIEVSTGAGKISSQWQEVVDRAKSQGVRVKKGQSDKNFGKNDKSSPHKQGSQKQEREGGYSALIKGREPVSLSELFDHNKGNQGGLWIALDQIQDPHNLGAIFRSASFFGCDGIILPEDRSASLTGTVYDTASGGVESLPFAIETNLIRTLEQAKEDFDVWTIGTSEHATESITSLPKDRHWILVLGNEESGLREKVKESCDYLVSIPSAHSSEREGVTSLNVSVAMGVFAYHLKQF